MRTMEETRKKLLGLFALASIIAASTSTALAADPWPSKMVHFVVPTAAAGGPDRVARVLADRLSKKWGVAVVVENRPGAALLVGTEHVARSAPDGYTYLLTFSTHVQAPFLFRNLRFDPIKDFAAVTQTVSVDTVIAVRADSPHRTLNDFIKAAKEANQPLTYGSNGQGSTFHLYGEALGKASGVKLLHVPYKGEAQALSGLLGNEIESSFGTLSTMLPMIRTGKVRALAVAGPDRTPVMPELPTFPELGVPQLNVRGWFGMLAPAGTPINIVKRVSADVAEVLRTPDVEKSLADQGLRPAYSTPEEFSARIASDFEMWRTLIQQAGVKPQE
jgi:tripartite-type tricarboxylate transporter receptor subunit TctC